MKKISLFLVLLAVSGHSFCQMGFRTSYGVNAYNSSVYWAVYNIGGTEYKFNFRGSPPLQIGLDLETGERCR